MDDQIISCFVDSTCRGIQCALDVSFISRTFEFFMKLEPCEYSLKVGIERLQFERTLKGFKWGEWINVDLNGIFRME
jgi:hypothetical protein